MASEPVKRGRGRPRKVCIDVPVKDEETITFKSLDELREYLKKENISLEEKPKNPDCEPATKGYVKWIARKMTRSPNHVHKLQNWKPIFGILAACSAGALVSAGLYGECITNAALASQAPVFAGMFCTCSLIVLGGVVGTNFSTTETNISSSLLIPDAIQKYESPKCDSKKECE